MKWGRNLLFLSICLLAASGIGATLLNRNRIEPPRSFPVARADSERNEVVEAVNRQFRAHWQKLDLEVAPPATSLNVARRISLGLTGTIPSLEEIRILEQQDDEDRVTWWISRLVEDRRYSDYVAERLARAYVGTENGPFLVFRRRRFVSWLSDQLHQNEPYNEMVRQILGNGGLWTDTPSVNFMTVTVDQNDEKNRPDPIRLAARTSRAFLGVRIDCLQCHDDQLGNVALGSSNDPRDGMQSDFHQLAAFFAETQNSLVGIHDKTGESYKYKYLEAEEQEVVPAVVPFFPELRDEQGTLRQQLSNWVTHKENRPFGRAIVNRVWALMFGRPLIEPIDDIPLYGEFPPGMEVLTDDFMAHGFDLQRLMRIIAATEVYQLSSRADFEVTAKHERQWAVFPLSRLRPEQVAGCAIQASSLKTIDANAHILFQLARDTQQNEFIKRYGDTGDDEFTERGGTITQRLIMMNGKLIKERTQPGMFTASARIAALAPTDDRAVETAYLTVLSRRPSPKERDHFVAKLEKAEGKKERLGVVEDIFWVLINSTEFCWNH